ncbi:MAG: MmgE/PrpD family protein [Spirochaetota bacterium]|nr:MmgE/PrpD family protein [Spirochaetota bacterium]
MGLTKTIAKFIVDTKETDIPSAAYDHSKVAFMDWLAVTMAAKDDPLVEKLIRYADQMGGFEQASIIGHNMKKTVSQATLINGSASHALDYDDTLATFLGHPSVTIFPSILAISEWKEKSGHDFLTAYIIGIKVGATVGMCAGGEHYLIGWHGTSTLGHFASAAACARLLGLNEEQTVNALGIAGTQASGLKRVFGTMCKPFHAGKSSDAGLLSALLAREGFTSADDILEGAHGFFQVLKGQENEDVINTLGKTWEVENIAQKYHASCHATHSPIEAARNIVQKENINLDDIESIKISSSQLSCDAAGKTEVNTGLEGKFSIPYCVANALLRGNTGMQAFTDEKVNDQKIKDLMTKISLVLDDQKLGLESTVEIETKDGRVNSAFSDILQEIPEYEVKKDKIKAKFLDLCSPILGEAKTIEIVEDIFSLENQANMKGFIEKFNV